MMPENVKALGLAKSRFEQLQCALVQGWRIEAPAYLRSQWHDSNKEGFYFVLKRGGDIDLIVVPDSGAIREWLAAQRLKVIVG